MNLWDACELAARQQLGLPGEYVTCEVELLPHTGREPWQVVRVQLGVRFDLPEGRGTRYVDCHTTRLKRADVDALLPAP